MRSELAEDLLDRPRCWDLSAVLDGAMARYKSHEHASPLGINLSEALTARLDRPEDRTQCTTAPELVVGHVICANDAESPHLVEALNGSSPLRILAGRRNA